VAVDLPIDDIEIKDAFADVGRCRQQDRVDQTERGGGFPDKDEGRKERQMLGNCDQDRQAAETGRRMGRACGRG
jgi:hypothetical protein